MKRIQGRWEIQPASCQTGRPLPPERTVRCNPDGVSTPASCRSLRVLLSRLHAGDEALSELLGRTHIFLLDAVDDVVGYTKWTECTS